MSQWLVWSLCTDVSCVQVKPGVLVSTQLLAGLDAAMLEELLLRQQAGDDVAAKALAALRCRGILAGVSF